MMLMTQQNALILGQPLNFSNYHMWVINKEFSTKVLDKVLQFKFNPHQLEHHVKGSQ